MKPDLEDLGGDSGGRGGGRRDVFFPGIGGMEGGGGRRMRSALSSILCCGAG